MFKDAIFYLRWYNVIHWSSHIYKKSSFPSFYSYLVKFSEWHTGSGIVKLTKCDKVEWDEKWRHASDILFEWPHVSFVVLLSYYFLLRESYFSWEPQSYFWNPKCLENFSASVLLIKESSSWASENGTLQMFFLTPNRNMLAGKFVSRESFLPVF